jgi:hypothetical protein
MYIKNKEFNLTEKQFHQLIAVQFPKESNYYFLYTVKTQFHYLPVAVFNSEQEICRFDLLREGKQLLKLW